MLIDDEPAICWTMEQALADDGHEARAFPSAESALDELDTFRPDVVLLDVRLPGMNGLEALERLQSRLKQTPVVIMTAFGSLNIAVEAIERGAFDYLPKPFDLDQAMDVVNRALANRRSPAPTEIDQPPTACLPGEIIGHSRAMQNVFRQVALVAGQNVPVLISGESGVGKELVARAIHQRSSQSTGAFVPICIPALSPTLFESELFGHVKGAFTGADRDRRGLLRNADGGTAFFDEIGEVPLLQQVKLLRVLDDRQLTPVGSSRAEPSSFRLIAATNRSLEELVAKGEFREDLYYRLRVFPIHVPPLRERPEDIAALAQHFLTQAAGDRSLALADRTIAELQRGHWAGNVRELRAAMQYATVVTRGGVVTPECLPPVPQSELADEGIDRIRADLRRWASERAAALLRMPAHSGLHTEFLGRFEEPILQAALDAVQGNRTAAADLLGLHRETLRKRLQGGGTTQ